MTRQSIRRRLEKLELKQNSGDKPIAVVYQSLDDPDLYYWVGDPEKLMTEQDALDRFEGDHTLIWVTYRKDWRGHEA